MKTARMQNPTFLLLWQLLNIFLFPSNPGNPSTSPAIADRISECLFYHNEGALRKGTWEEFHGVLGVRPFLYQYQDAFLAG